VLSKMHQVSMPVAASVASTSTMAVKYSGL
jgi:hypothetical protein